MHNHVHDFLLSLFQISILQCSNNSCRVAYHPLCAHAAECGVGFAVFRVDPTVLGVGPAFAIPAVVKSAGLELCDIALFEINEAFASQFVYSCKKLGLDHNKVNVNDDAIALGNPLGATGGCCVVTLLDEMKYYGNRFGVISMCTGEFFYWPFFLNLNARKPVE
ncbi:hypothetical protein HN873_023938 [Arachis hypogaea]